MVCHFGTASDRTRLPSLPSHAVGTIQCNDGACVDCFPRRRNRGVRGIGIKVDHTLCRSSNLRVSIHRVSHHHDKIKTIGVELTTTSVGGAQANQTLAGFWHCGHKHANFNSHTLLSRSHSHWHSHSRSSRHKHAERNSQLGKRPMSSWNLAAPIYRPAMNRTVVEYTRRRSQRRTDYDPARISNRNIPSADSQRTQRNEQQE